MQIQKGTAATRGNHHSAVAAALVLLALTGIQVAAQDFTYDNKLAIDLKQTGIERRGRVAVRDITYANLSGGRTAAYLVEPKTKKRGPGVLFVHWLEPEAKDSNRTQFLEQAVSLAQSGVHSLLIETMWSDPEWFRKRSRAQDYDNSVKQVKELRRALDVLLAEPQVDRKRVAYVGHDFGMMYGAVLAGADKRVKVWALQAGTTSLSDWFLLGPKIDGETRRRFIERLAPLDPVRYIGKASPAPILMQFGRADRYVPEAKAKEFFSAAGEPKTILWYDAGHGLNAAAVADRTAWLRKQLHLPPS